MNQSAKSHSYSVVQVNGACGRRESHPISRLEHRFRLGAQFVQQRVGQLQTATPKLSCGEETRITTCLFFLFILMSSFFSRAPLLCNWLRTREPCNPQQLHTAGNGGRDLFQSRRLTCNRSRLCPRGEQRAASSPRFVWLGPTVCERVEGFAGDVQHGESRALGLRGPPAGQGGLQGGRPVADHSQGLALHWDDLTALRFGGVGVWLGH